MQQMFRYFKKKLYIYIRNQETNPGVKNQITMKKGDVLFKMNYQTETSVTFYQIIKVTNSFVFAKVLKQKSRYDEVYHDTKYDSPIINEFKDGKLLRFKPTSIYEIYNGEEIEVGTGYSYLAAGVKRPS